MSLIHEKSAREKLRVHIMQGCSGSGCAHPAHMAQGGDIVGEKIEMADKRPRPQVTNKSFHDGGILRSDNLPKSLPKPRSALSHFPKIGAEDNQMVPSDIQNMRNPKIVGSDIEEAPIEEPQVEDHELMEMVTTELLTAIETKNPKEVLEAIKAIILNVMR